MANKRAIVELGWWPGLSVCVHLCVYVITTQMKLFHYKLLTSLVQGLKEWV